MGLQLGLFDAEPAAPAPVVKVPNPAHLSHPRANREVMVNGMCLAFEFKRSQRRTIGLTVSPVGLSVRAPRWAAVAEVDRFVQAKASWVFRKFQQVQDRLRLTPPEPVWAHGAEVMFLGRPLRLVLDPTHAFAQVGASLQAEELRLALPHSASGERVRDAVQAWLMREATRVFTERLDHFAPRLGVSYQRMRLSSAHTRWGSANAVGTIRLNWRLVHLNLDMIDYVVAHELSHLRQMNHSPDFWEVVHSVMPDYADRRRELKQVRLRP
jgi:predicted metal-dependent hydrolase